MTSFYKISTTCKSILFTSMVYGWFIPTVWVADQLGKLFPTRDLDSQAWVIEEGAPNTSWDFVSIDASDEVSLEKPTNLENEEVEIPIEKTESKIVNLPESEIQNQSTTEMGLATDSVELSAETGAKNHIDALPKRHHPVRKTIQAKPKAVYTKKRTARTGRCDATNPDIEKLGRMMYSVPKNTVKHYSTHWKQASRLAHLSWAMNPDGSRLGVRIRAISCRSPLKFTGLKRGDVVVTINGHSVQSEKDLLKVYGKLLFWKQMRVEVKRGNKLVTLQYDIV